MTQKSLAEVGKHKNGWGCPFCIKMRFLWKKELTIEEMKCCEGNKFKLGYNYINMRSVHYLTNDFISWIATLELNSLSWQAVFNLALILTYRPTVLSSFPSLLCQSIFASECEPLTLTHQMHTLIIFQVTRKFTSTYTRKCFLRFSQN